MTRKPDNPDRNVSGGGGPVGLALRPLDLHRGEEAFHRGVVPHVAGAAHRADDAVVRHQTLELIATVSDRDDGRCNLPFQLDDPNLPNVVSGPTQVELAAPVIVRPRLN